PSGPIQVRREITVTELEPGSVRQMAEGRLAGEGVAADPPTSRLIRNARQPVCDRVEIGSDIETVPPHVVAGVPDHDDLLRRHHPNEASKESRRADAARQDDDGPRTHSSIIGNDAAFPGPRIGIAPGRHRAMPGQQPRTYGEPAHVAG